MPECYDDNLPPHSGDENDLDGLDEYLTEYVDGTMDPTIREAFEELLERNPELVDQICCLQDVRCALHQLTRTCSAPKNVENRLHQSITFETLCSAASRNNAVSRQRPQVMGMTLVAAIVLSVGMFAVSQSSLFRSGAVAAGTGGSTPQAVVGEDGSQESVVPRFNFTYSIPSAWFGWDEPVFRSTPYHSPWLEQQTGSAAPDRAEFTAGQPAFGSDGTDAFRSRQQMQDPFSGMPTIQPRRHGARVQLVGE